MSRPKRYKRKPFKPINCDDFKELRLMNRLSIKDTAKLLHVTSRTISLWEAGSTRIPYAAFKLLRSLANGEILSDAWLGWKIRGDALWSPTGRAFRVYELIYLSHYFTMARFWLKDSELRRSQSLPVEVAMPPSLRLIVGGLKL